MSGESLDIELKPMTTYFYKVTVEGDLGDEATSEYSFLKRGKWMSLGR